MYFPEWFLEKLKDKNLTQAEFSRLCGEDTGLVNKWLKGERKPGAKKIPKIAKIFGISPDEIYKSLDIQTFAVPSWNPRVDEN